MILQSVAVGGVLGTRQLRLPINAHPTFDQRFVELSLLAEHEIDFDRLVQKFRSALVLRKLLLEAKQHPRQQEAVQLATVDGECLRAELIALIKTELEEQRRRFVPMGVAARHIPGDGEQGQNWPQVWIGYAVQLQRLGILVVEGRL